MRSVEGEVGATDDTGLGTVEADEPDDPDGVGMSGLTVGVSVAGRGLTDPGEDADGTEDGSDGMGDAADGLLAGGGASGTVGDTGVSGAVRRNGSAMTAATAHADPTPTPTATRSSRRRAAPRRIVSYWPGGGPR